MSGPLADHLFVIGGSGNMHIHPALSPFRYEDCDSPSCRSQITKLAVKFMVCGLEGGIIPEVYRVDSDR